MAIGAYFNGQQLLVPGVYTKTVPSTGAVSFPATGRVAIIGEADKGGPGSTDGVLQFSSDNLATLAAYFGSGQIVEAARMLVSPSNDSRIKNGASSILVFKTNASTKSSLSLLTSFGTLKSLNYGAKENLISTEILKISAVLDEKVGSAADISGTDLTGFSFSVREQGGAVNIFTSPGAIADISAMSAALADSGNWGLAAVPTGISFSFSGTDGAAILTISQVADSNDHKRGASQVAELIAGSVSDLLGFFGISASLMYPSQEPRVRSKVIRQNDSISEDSDDLGGDLGGIAYLEIGCDDSTCTLTINSTKLITTAATAEDLDISLNSFNTIEALADFIDSRPGYSASIPSGVNGGLSPLVLDRVTSLGIASASLKPGRVKADSYVMYTFYFNNSQLVELERDSYVGLPDAMVRSFLSGGSRGASLSSDFVAGLTELEKYDVDFIIPLISQDASDDIVEDSLFTDSSSTYDVDGVLAAVNTHCRKMSSTKRRKERQAYAGFRGTKEEVRAKSLALNSEFVSLLPFDVLNSGAEGDLVWFQPHMAACLIGGMHAGAEVGQSTTRKYINCQGIRHRKKQGVIPSALEILDSRVDADFMISNGITPLVQPSEGGVRCIVHNSTYSKDENFVYNRPSVLYAGHFVARTMRNELEAVFIGEKNKTSTPADLISYIAAIMADLKRADIIVGDSTNNGLGYKNLSIKVQGNTIYVNIVVTIVESVDFILPTITLDRAKIEI